MTNLIYLFTDSLLGVLIGNLSGLTQFPSNHPKRFATFTILISLLLIVTDMVSDWMLTKRLDIIRNNTDNDIKFFTNQNVRNKFEPNNDVSK